MARAQGARAFGVARLDRGDDRLELRDGLWQSSGGAQRHAAQQGHPVVELGQQLPDDAIAATLEQDGVEGVLRSEQGFGTGRGLGQAQELQRLAQAGDLLVVAAVSAALLLGQA